MRRIQWSRKPDEWEREILKEYIEEMMSIGIDIRKHYFFINLDTTDGAVEVIRYPEAAIIALANNLECSEIDALWCCGNFPGFLNEYREMLYWNDINGYRKYIVTTKTFDKLEQIKYHDSTFYSTSMLKAREEFTEIGFDVHKIIDVDD